MKFFVFSFLCVFLCKTVFAKVSLNGTIVGGVETEIDAFPYVCSIQAPGAFGRRHICAATVLSSEWVLTAAHCLRLFEDPHAFQVRFGVTYHDRSNDNSDISVSEKHVHPQYINEDKKYEYDLALLKLSTPIVFSDKIKAIQLPTVGTQLSADTAGVNAGWSDASAPNATVILNKIDFKVVGNVDCQAKHVLPITDNMICVNLPSTESATLCQGDAGSPFIVDQKIVGVTAYGVGCASVGSPAILTKVSTMVDWIKTVTSL